MDLQRRRAGFGTFTAYGFLPRFFQEPTSTGYGFGASVSEAGLMILPTPAFSFLFGMMAATFVRRTSIRLVLCCGALLTGTAFVLMTLFHGNPAQVFFWTAVQGAGAGLSFSTLAAGVLLAVPPRQSGVASGMNANIRTIGGAIGTAVTAALLSATDGPTGQPTEDGWTLVFVVITCAFFVAAGMSLLVPSSPAARRALADAGVATDSPPRPGAEALP